MKTVLCPFCGVVSDTPHETQEGCIDALHAEIARTRQVLETVTEPLPPALIAPDEETQTC